MMPALSFWSPPVHLLVTAVHIFCGVFWLGWMVIMFAILRPVVTRVAPDRAAQLQGQIQRRIRRIVFWLIPAILLTGLYNPDPLIQKASAILHVLAFTAGVTAAYLAVGIGG